MTVKSLNWMGVRTGKFAETVAFYRDVLHLETIRGAPAAVWFRLENGVEIHVYGVDDEDHGFFGSGPVVGLEVDDFAEIRAETIASGIELIGDPQKDGRACWNHFVGPDGNVYEIIQRG